MPGWGNVILNTYPHAPFVFLIVTLQRGSKMLMMKEHNKRFGNAVVVEVEVLREEKFGAANDGIIKRRNGMYPTQVRHRGSFLKLSQSHMTVDFSPSFDGSTPLICSQCLQFIQITAFYFIIANSFRHK